MLHPQPIFFAKARRYLTTFKSGVSLLVFLEEATRIDAAGYMDNPRRQIRQSNYSAREPAVLLKLSRAFSLASTIAFRAGKKLCHGWAL